MLEENKEMEAMDYEAILDKKTDELTELLDKRDMKALQKRMEELNEFDVAEFLSEIDDTRMPMVFRLLSKETAAEVFANFEAPEQERIINSITDSELAGIVEELYVDDAVDMMEEMPANVVKRVMRTAKPATRNLINQYLNYPENSAGSIMTSEYVDLKKYMNVKESIARIRRIGEDKETIYVCFVISADRKLEGIVTVKDLLLSDDDTIIEDLMDTNVIFASTTEDQESVSEKFSDYDLMALPVVDKEGRLVGIVTVDDVIDVMEQETTEDFEIMAGMTPSDKPYSRSGIIEMWKNRIPWLMFLMLSATFTSMILTSFENRLAVQAGLIAFIPMLMGTGGNSGHTKPIPRRHRAARRAARRVEGAARGAAVRRDPRGGELYKDAADRQIAAWQRKRDSAGIGHGESFDSVRRHVREGRRLDAAYCGGENRRRPCGHGKPAHLDGDGRRFPAHLHLRGKACSAYIKTKSSFQVYYGFYFPDLKNDKLHRADARWLCLREEEHSG